MIFLLMILLIFLILLLLYFFHNGFRTKLEKFISIGNKKIFRAPISKTQLFRSSKDSNESSSANNSVVLGSEGIKTNMSEFLLIKLPQDSIDYKGNRLSFPGFFHVGEKWPGCLPRPLYQGTCGSCWGFAAVTSLSSRFYIESCGLAGCLNYPQINFGSLNEVNNSINEIYKFRTLYLTNVFRYIDTNRSNKINKKEWVNSIKKYCELFNGIGTPFSEKHYIVQVLTYILDFQSLGSVNLYDCDAVIERANEVFDVWRDYTDNKDPKNIIDPDEYIDQDDGTIKTEEIDISLLEEKWKSSPISLSAEKIIACCVECVKNDFKADPKTGELILKNDSKSESNIDLICIGGSLDEAWSTLRSSGTPTSTCIGYNMDSYSEGDESPTCKTVQGPFYSFCSGYAIVDKHTSLIDMVDKFEKSGIDPIAIPGTDKNLPWIDPQLLIFRAKNVYKIKNDQYSIQREILERGPVTTGFDIYPDFQYSFGTDGLGGQLFKPGTNPLGSTKESLIYKWSGKGSSMGGHAIVIVGWGTYIYEPYNDPTLTEKEKEKYGDKQISIPYWICLNSWGYNWGTSGFSKVDNRTKEPYRLKKGGYFWILRGTNECAIEDNVVVGQPDIENITYPGIVQRYGWGLPSPDNTLVEYIRQHTYDELPNGIKFIYDNPIEGGGTYITPEMDTTMRPGMSPTMRPGMNPTMSPTNRPEENKQNWVVTSMKKPSPYTLFWYDKDRPIFCLGSIKEKLDALTSDNIILVDSETINKIKEIKKYQKNPLIVIDNEQLQIIDIIEDLGISVNRSVNNSTLESHTKGSKIKVIPFRQLSVDILEKIISLC